METEFRDSMESRLKKGYLLPKQPEILQGMDPLFGLLQNKQLVILSLLDGAAKAACEQGAGECTGTAGGVL